MSCLRFLIIAFALPGVAAASKASEIAAGLVEGFLFGPSIKECIQDSKIEFKDFEDAISDFEKKDALDVLKGLHAVADALKTFPDALRTCKASEQSVQQVLEALKHFQSPEQFAYHIGKNLWVNRHDIYTEINTAISDYKSQKFTDFGLQLGEALHKLIVGLEERFEEFVARHNKTYSSSEERLERLAAFAKNYEYLYHVQRTEEGTAKYSYLSPFSDLSTEEFSMRNGYKYSGSRADSLVELLEATDLPDSFDWRSKGAVNPVKNQAQCGSCWAFATVANIEGAGFVATGKLVSLSEQELVDCDKDTGDEGCQGGLPSNAYKDMIKDHLGLELESVYPYKARGGTCQKDSSKEVAFISAWQQISSDETQIAAALVKYGPLAIGINANAMQWYMGGIASPFKFLCNPKSLDHGVAIVGYGAENAKKYWVIRNSWGATWGEKGYYRIIRGTGACGLNTDVTTATGVKISSAQHRDVVV